MLQLTPHMRILVAVEPVDGRKGIDSLAALCRRTLLEDPFSGAVFLFINRSRTAIRALCYDGNGYWLVQKRLSKGTFRGWPTADRASQAFEPHQVQALLAGGPPGQPQTPWRPITPKKVLK